MILYGSSLSPFVRKVMFFCAAGGIEYSMKPVGLGSDDAGFLAASPLRKMPAIDDDGFTLADSSAICHYLETKHKPGLIPTDAQGLGRAVWLDECADTVLFMALQPAFFNRVVSPLFMGRSGDAAAAAAQAMAEAAPRALAWLEGEVPADGYLMGNSISFADCAMASPLVNLAHIRAVSGDGDLTPYPKLAAYWERMCAWEPLAQTLTFETKAIAKAQARLAAAG